MGSAQLLLMANGVLVEQEHSLSGKVPLSR